MLRLLFIFIACQTLTHHSMAGPGTSAPIYRLFNKSGSPNENYQSILQKIINREEEPFILEFYKDGHIIQYKVDHYIDAGSTTVILRTGNGKALRIPKRVGYVPGVKNKVEDFITHSLDTYQTLKSQKAKAVKMYPNLSIPGQLAVVDYIENFIDLNEALRLMKNLKAQNTEASLKEYQVMKKSLIEFTRSFAPFKMVGDLRENQVAYGSRSGFILADWGDINETRMVQYIEESTIFNNDASDLMKNLMYIRGEVIPATVSTKLDNIEINLMNELIQETKLERVKRGYPHQPSCFQFLFNLFKRKS